MTCMARIHVAHTGDLSAVELQAARALLDDAFPVGDMTDDDWDHALGGMHALVYEDNEVIGHASVVQRRLRHVGRALRAGYVECLAVRADRRRRGYGSLIMAELERIIRHAYDLGALGASDDGVPFYLGRDWQRWRGPTSVLTPQGIVRTPEEDGNVLVLPTSVPLDLDGELTCDWRDGDVW
jgi:aminoglycoside 2'-N-acetyltransferase I